MRMTLAGNKGAASPCIWGLVACGGVAERTVTERKNQTASAGAPNQGGARSSLRRLQAVRLRAVAPQASTVVRPPSRRYVTLLGQVARRRAGPMGAVPARAR